MAADAKCAYNYIGLGELDLRNGNVKSAEDLFKGPSRSTRRTLRYQ